MTDQLQQVLDEHLAHGMSRDVLLAECWKRCPQEITSDTMQEIIQSLFPYTRGYHGRVDSFLRDTVEESYRDACGDFRTDHSPSSYDARD
jgi:hypothetical protein